ncbi:hypothetical protein ACFRLW_18325 [Streptomyces sp. NPDC056728]
MSDRFTATTITDDVLDELYAQRDAWQRRADDLIQRLRDVTLGPVARTPR